MGFLRSGQKKQIILERRPGKPGKTFLVVEYIVAPSGFDPRMPFVEGAEVGQVKILVIAYRDIAPHLQGKAVTQHGQKLRAPVMINDEKIEREIEELYGIKDAPQSMFKFDDKSSDIDEKDDEERKVEDKIKRSHEKIHSSKKLTISSQPTKNVTVADVEYNADDTRSAVGVIDSNDSGGRLELIRIIKDEVEKISEEFEIMKSLIAEQQRKVDDKLEKALSDLPYMKFVLILIVTLFVLHVSLLRS
ncbi:unnamed protein product [Cercopithifilaria johnstoni]|uniref:Uncharacterized protein n=1 Tax=Cercopithifilaria johnstoni TaxID=2874296 RepID=A0A8J2MFZ9_9BILA|nr:unnamed protein product [Cercopithifilaria johnstoni]